MLYSRVPMNQIAAKKNIRFALFVLVLALMACVATVTTATTLRGKALISSSTNEVSSLATSDVTVAATSASDEYFKETDEIKEDLQALVKNENPRAAFRELRAAMARDPHLANICHEFTHYIGDAAFEKYRNFKDAV